MLRVGTSEEDDEPILAVYCPYCAEGSLGLPAASTRAKPVAVDARPSS